MMLLVSGATATMRRLKGEPHLGVLLSPRDRNAIPDPAWTWAADNSCFTAFDHVAFVRFLDRIAGTAPLFVCCPDVVADAAATDRLWQEWQPQLAARGLRAAYVLQDGATAIPLEAAAVFVGGSTRFKTSSHVAALIGKAKARGLWVHMGRVNTLSRIALAHQMGVDSFDGSKYSRWPEVHIERAVSELARLEKQHTLAGMRGGENG